MPYEFVVQPFDDGFHLRDFFELIRSDDAITTLDIVVAWVKRTGLVEVQGAMEAFRARGGTIRAIAGISQGGTSKQGLGLLRELVDEPYVFHHPGRTFHPKVFLASGTTHAAVMVGSHNFTLGGVTRNYEAGVLGELVLANEDDARFFDEVSGFVSRLLGDAELCHPLTPTFLEQLIANPRYPLADEDQPKGAAEPVEGETPVEEQPTTAPTLFGSSKNTMRTAAKAVGGPPPGAPPTGSATPSAPPAAVTVVRRWYKKLPAADAQQLVGSSPSNTMTLVQFRHPIQAATYFRDEFFGDEDWSQAQTRGRGQAREIATIECYVTVHGTDLGSEVFDVRYTPGYDADEANRTTELAWRDFGAYLRSNNVTDSFATLEKTDDGNYRLTIADAPTGPFLY